jgi:hypothetical protein
VQNEALIAAEMKVKKQETSTESGKPGKWDSFA